MATERLGPNVVTFSLSVGGAEYSVAYGPATATAIILGPIEAGKKAPILHMIGQLETVEKAKQACEEWLRNPRPAAK